ncbi:MAG: HlyD family type I secretion periplasmic adaptor subunit [Silicimonas sp.]|nr:HlyD family type I secretion periplasmic adaptor subunit [Silicimonas sp.]
MSVRPTYSTGLPILVGFTALILLVGGVGLWSVRTQIAGAVIANGMIVVENNRQIVQHPEGGIIGSIEARDGDAVPVGALLLRLDDTLLRSELSVAELQLTELGARRARLRAERDAADTIAFPAALLDLDEATALEQIEGQRTLFSARRISLEKEQSQIAERINQTGNQIEGAEAQLEALAIQEALIRAELTDQETLLEKGLVQAARVSSLRREAARLAGDIGRLRSDVAQYNGQIAAFEIEMLKLETSRREAAITQLRDIQYRELELGEQRRSLLERLSRLEVRTPVAGIVYGSTVFAQKAVIQPAEPLMYVIPQDQPLIINARVEAIHIDQIFVGQPATLRFTAFNQRLTPEVSGHVMAISADVFQDEFTGLNYYRVELAPKTAELPKLEDQGLLPGMPVEAYLRTEDRTPLSYLTKPLTDYFGRALREG